MEEVRSMPFLGTGTWFFPFINIVGLVVCGMIFICGWKPAYSGRIHQPLSLGFYQGTNQLGTGGSTNSDRGASWDLLLIFFKPRC
jgi:hypothetical protein